MEGKNFWKTPHSFDMSEYFFGERFELGGVDFDQPDEAIEDLPEKTEKPIPFHHGHNEPNT